MLAAEGFGNRHCFLENIADKNIPPDLSQCVFVIEQALSVRALQELVTAAGSESVRKAFPWSNFWLLVFFLSHSPWLLEVGMGFRRYCFFSSASHALTWTVNWFFTKEVRTWINAMNGPRSIVMCSLQLKAATGGQLSQPTIIYKLCIRYTYLLVWFIIITGRRFFSEYIQIDVESHSHNLPFSCIFFESAKIHLQFLTELTTHFWLNWQINILFLNRR